MVLDQLQQRQKSNDQIQPGGMLSEDGFKIIMLRIFERADDLLILFLMVRVVIVTTSLKGVKFSFEK